MRICCSRTSAIKTIFSHISGRTYFNEYLSTYAHPLYFISDLFTRGVSWTAGPPSRCAAHKIYLLKLALRL